MASVILAGTTSTTALNLTGDTSGELQLKTNNGSTTALTLTTGGNINIPTTGARITGDFSNATASNRVAFQTSTVNGNTSVSVLPNGTGTAAHFRAWNNSDPTNAASFTFQAGATEAIINSSINGTGSFIPITMYTGGSERLRIDTSGNVGIGTSSPLEKLDVLGIFVASDANRQFVRLRMDSGVARVESTFASGASGAYRPLAFSTSDTERMRITSGGLVGIGTSSPNERLMVAGAIRSTSNALDFAGSDGALIDYNAGDMRIVAARSGANSSNITFWTYNSGSVGERMRIRANGQVIVSSNGSTTSDRQFVVDTNSAESVSSVFRGGSAESYIGFRGTGVANDYQVMCGINNTSFAIFTANTERMRITSGGDLLIGKTTTANDTSGISLSIGAPNFVTSVSSSDGPYIQVVNLASSILSGYRFYSFRVGPSRTEVGSISTNGTSTTAYNTSSDYRLKENIAPMTGALNKVAQLKPVTYTWKSDGSNGQGFIAHELQAVVPDCVTGEKDAVDADGNPRYQGVDTSFLVATLTAAIQEQQAMIEELKQEVAKLKGV